MKKVFTLLSIIMLMSGAASAGENENEIESRLSSMSCLVPNKTDAAIISRINSFFRAKSETEQLIGRSSTYFPIYDKLLHDYKLPEDLKYVTVLETELKNNDLSHSGAAGLWQLMPDVREEFGLRISSSLDERYDFIRSTEAALKDFKRMHNAYGDWELVLAGYNCGPGRLAAAIKKGRTKDFSKLKKFLPEETQKYVPKFVAFTYLMKHYKDHGLKAKLPELDLQVIGSVKLHHYITLQQIAEITGCPTETIKHLNMQFGEGFVPDDEKGNSVYVPLRVLGVLEEFLTNPDNQPHTNFNFAPMVLNDDIPALKDDPNYFKTSYTVGEGETLEQLSEIFNCHPYNIQLWNSLGSDLIYIGQELTIYMPRVVPKRV
jgi:membrane-bound lytic murein transglycosylase D